MVERKTDLRVLKTRNAIRNTFKEMIMEKKASQITIKELTERAMIHRKTFYLHYTCIEALFEDIQSELSGKYYEVIDKVPEDAPFTEVNRVFFECMAAQEPYMEKIEKSYVTAVTRNFPIASSCVRCSTTARGTIPMHPFPKENRISSIHFSA